MLFSVSVCFAVEAPRNPNSAKECAICHYRWIDTFFIDGRGSALVPYQDVPVVASAEICFSCHDGSVVDSRAKIFNDHRHQINKPPPKHMKIPAIFPLDKDGKMQCATCHTAHGVSSEMGIEKTIFLRTSNLNSAMCMMCHTDKTGGPLVGNHPVNTTALEIPTELLERGAMEGSKKNQVICETCHTVHGSPNESFLVESVKGSGICMSCHKEQAVIVNSEHDLRITAAQARNGKGLTVGESGVCGTCHKVHGGGKRFLWARGDIKEGSELDVSQQLCNDCHSHGGAAEKKLVKDHSHPVDVAPGKKGLSTSLPLYARDGSKSESRGKGLMTCPTCHDPHRWDPLGGKAPGRNQEGSSRNSFLRVENSPVPKLCGDCHKDQVLAVNTDHDLIVTVPESFNSAGQKPLESGVCGVCHLVHGGGKKFLWARKEGRRSRHASQDMCESCHVQGGEASKKLVVRSHSHPLNVAPGKKRMETDLPLYDKRGDKTKKGVMTCQTCHDPHKWSPGVMSLGIMSEKEGSAKNSFLRMPASPAPELCEDCHGTQALVAGSDHDLLLTAADSVNLAGQKPEESGPCGVCHAVHNSSSRAKLWNRELGRGDGVLDKMCRSCHRKGRAGKDKIPEASTHPKKKLVTNVGRDIKGRPDYFPLFNKSSGKSVKVGDIACASCHDVHQWNPRVAEKGPGRNEEGTASSSFLRLQTFNMVCTHCHGVDALFRFKYYHDSQKRGVRHP